MGVPDCRVARTDACCSQIMDAGMGGDPQASQARWGSLTAG